MGLNLRVVVPPHPLIAHWLTMARDAQTPPPLFRTAIQELGRWLGYEALRDWLPHRSVTVTTPLGQAEGAVIDAQASLAVVPILRAGLGLWEGAQSVLPHARIWHAGLRRDDDTATPQWYFDGLPTCIPQRMGVMVLDPVLATGGSLLSVLERLRGLGVQGRQLRVVTVLCSRPGLQAVAEAMPDLVLYTAGVDPELNDQRFIVPGLGDAGDRLFGTDH